MAKWVEMAGHVGRQSERCLLRWEGGHLVIAKHSGDAWERLKADQMISIAVTQWNGTRRESKQ